ncbi:hypothetical protein R1flu_004730 [Riccia fluitans]|uniref:Uncharacterized protein n=1 Tax=Riccia fluitans TaxID=41844 RepID=A0ABD1YR48_9MARC
MFVVVLESSSCSTAAMRFSSFPCPFFESSLLSRPCWRSTSPAPFCSLSRDCVWRGSSGAMLLGLLLINDLPRIVLGIVFTFSVLSILDAGSKYVIA